LSRWGSRRSPEADHDRDLVAVDPERRIALRVPPGRGRDPQESADLDDAEPGPRRPARSGPARGLARRWCARPDTRQVAEWVKLQRAILRTVPAPAGVSRPVR
jgi:hypothetical protein